MQSELTWISPHTASGSVLSSIAVHVLLCAAIVGVMSTDLLKSAPPMADVSLDYEVLDEPPEAKPIAKAPRVREPVVPVQPKTAVTETAKELQDEKSEIAGTQKASETPTVGSGGDSGAEAVPYYKIKP